MSHVESFEREPGPPGHAEHEGFLPKALAKWLIVVLVVVLAVILIGAQSPYRLTALLSYVNICLIVFVCYRLAQTGGLPGILLCLFMLPLLTAWPVPMLYASLFAPGAYDPSSSWGPVYWLEAGERVQLALLTFLAGFVPLIALGVRGKQSSPPVSPVTARRWATTMGSVFIAISLFQAVFGEQGVSANFGGGSLLQYLANGLYIYGMGLVFIPCALITYLSRTAKIVFFSVLGLMAFAYTVGNLRGFVMTLMLSMGAGLLASSMSKKMKMGFLIGFICVMPLYVVVGNTTRRVLGSKGLEDFAYRTQVLASNWRESVEISKPVEDLLGRLQMGGGHAVIAYTPEYHPYQQFDAVYMGENIISSMVWARLTGWSRESASYVLNDYGFMVNDYTSVEISLIGHLWLLGGFPSVFLGGVCIGLVYYLQARVLRRAIGYSYVLGLVIVGVLIATYMAGPAFDISSNVGSPFRAFIFAFVIYLGLRIFLGDKRASPSDPYSGYGMVGVVS